MKGFKNVKAYVKNNGLINTDIAFEKGVITAIGDNLDITEPITLDKNSIVLPGFIDRHVHGANSSDTMDGQLDALSNLSDSLAKEGTTSYLATTMTCSKEDIINSLSSVDKYINLNREDGAELIGVHLEGPFISEKYIGAQPLKYVNDPDINLIKEYISSSGNKIKLITLAPEENGAIDFINAVTNMGVKVSVGHSDAGYDAITKAMEVGLNSVTHTFNAQRGVHHRELGVAGTALLLDELYAEVICDFIHLSIPALKLIVKCKPKDKLILITDSMRAKGLPDGESELGGQRVYVKNGEARLNNGALAGSVLKMNDAVKNLVSLGVELTDAVDCASFNPAKSLNLDNEIGSIAVNKKANFAVVNENFEVIKTFRNGKVIFEK